MVNKAEILDLKEYLVNEYYSTLRKYQQVEQDYYDDKFEIPQIKEPMPKCRTGRAARLIDRPVEHIITSNPQVLIDDIRAAKAKDNKVLTAANRQWIPSLKRQNPNPFKEATRKCLLRGESWIQLSHNPSWVTGKKEKVGLPVLFLTPDPMIIYADPDEYEGIPKQVIIWCERLPRLVKQMYPDWSNPKNKRPNEKVNFLAYYNANYRYFEADDQPLLKGEIQKNIYGLVPFIHALSGFGCQTSLGEPADLIVGRLRKCQNQLVREAAIASSIDGIIYLLGQPQHMFELSGANEYPSDMLEGVQFGLGKAIMLPPGVKHVDYQGIQPTPQMFQWYDRIEQSLEWEDPRVLVGIPEGTSGRQQEMAATSAMTRYDTVVENVEAQFTTAFNKALEIMRKVPGLMPPGISEDDIGEGYYIKLRAENQLEDERKATLGSRLYQQNEIDLMTNLVEYQGKTVEEAKEIIINIMVDMVTFRNPQWAQMAGMAAADEMGMEKYLEALKQEGQSLAGQQQGLMGMPSSTEQVRRTGEIQSPLGGEMIDEAMRTKGGRRPPQSFYRGGM